LWIHDPPTVSIDEILRFRATDLRDGLSIVNKGDEARATDPRIGLSILI
jgi:hypothetical protein